MTPSALWDMINAAKHIHDQERQLTIASIEAIGALEACNASYNLNLTLEEFCEMLSISPECYWRRLKIFRLFKNFPQFRAMFERGETWLSHLALIAGKVRDHNAEIIFDAIKGASKREVEALAKRIDNEGNIGESRGTYKWSVDLEEADFELLNRVRQVLANSGTSPSNEAVFEAMAKCFLDRKDPMEKAKRSAARAPNPVSPVKVKVQTEVPTEAPAKASNNAAAETAEKKPTRKAIPAAVKSAVYLRDNGQCTFTGKSGKRCSARHMLEFDHIQMVCRGGQNSVDNIRLRCLN